MRGPLAAHRGKRHSPEGARLLLLCLCLSALLLSLQVSPYTSRGFRPPHPGLQGPLLHQRVKSGVFENDRYSGASNVGNSRLADRWGPPRGPPTRGPPLGAEETRRGPRKCPLSAVGGPYLSPEEQDSQGRQATFAAEQRFLHDLLMRVFKLHERMRGLLDHHLQQQQQQQHPQQQQKGSTGVTAAASVPLLHLYEKRDGSCVAAADLATQVMIMRALKSQFPGDLCIAEETVELFSQLLLHTHQLQRKRPEGAPRPEGPLGRSPQGRAAAAAAAKAAAAGLLRELGMPEGPLQEWGSPHPAPTTFSLEAQKETAGASWRPTHREALSPAAAVSLEGQEAPLRLLRELVLILATAAPDDLLAVLQEGLAAAAAATAAADAATPSIADAATESTPPPAAGTNPASGSPYTTLFLRGLQRLLQRPEAHPAAAAAADADADSAAADADSAAADADSAAAAAGDKARDRAAARRQRCWIVDPIDGTLAFFGASKGQCFSTAVALLEGPLEHQQQRGLSTQNDPRADGQQQQQQQQQQQLVEGHRVVVASICCPSYDLWRSSNSRLLPFCCPGPPRQSVGSVGPQGVAVSPSTSNQPLCQQLQRQPPSAAADAAADAGVEVALPTGKAAGSALSEATWGAPGLGGPTLCSDGLRGCVLTVAEDLPARLTVWDARSGAPVHLRHQQQQQRQQQQQQQKLVLPFVLEPGSHKAQLPWCNNRAHLSRNSRGASAASAGAAAAAASGGGSLNPFRWTLSTPNYQQTHPLLQRHLSSAARRQQGPPSGDCGPTKPCGVGGPEASVPFAKRGGGAPLHRALEPGSGGPPLQGPHDAPPGQQFLALRCGHVVKYLAVALGHADAFILLPSTHKRHQQQQQQQQQQEQRERRGGHSKPRLMVWDHAAGAAVVEMLGGVVVDSNWHRVQSYCYLSLPPRAAAAAAAAAAAVAVADTTSIPSSFRRCESPQVVEGYSCPLNPRRDSFLLRRRRGEKESRRPPSTPLSPPEAFVLMGEGLIAAGSLKAAARALAALKALKTHHS